MARVYPAVPRGPPLIPHVAARRARTRRAGRIAAATLALLTATGLGLEVAETAVPAPPAVAPVVAVQAPPQEAADFASTAYGNAWDFGDPADTSGMMLVQPPAAGTTWPTYSFPAPSGGDLVVHPPPQSQLYLVRNWGAGALATGRDGTARPIDAGRFRWLSFEATLPTDATNVHGGILWSTCADDRSSSCQGGRPIALQAGTHRYSFRLDSAQAPRYPGRTAAWAGAIHQLLVTPNAERSPAPRLAIHWIRIHEGPLGEDPGTSWAPPEPEPRRTGTPVVDARPRPVVLDPDLAGGQDYATTVRGGDAWDFDQPGDVAHWANATLSFQGGRMRGSSAGPAPNDPVVVLSSPGTFNARRWHRLTLHMGYDGPFGLHDAGGGGMVGRVVWHNPSLPGSGTQEANDLVVFPGQQQVSLDLHTTPPSAINDDEIPYRAGWGGVGSMVLDSLRWDPHEDRGARSWWVDHVRLARNDLADPTFAIRFRDDAWESGTTARLSLVAAPGQDGGVPLHTGTRPVVAGENTFTLDARALPEQGLFHVRLELTDPGGATSVAWSTGPVETGTPVEFTDVDPHGSFFRDVSWVVKEGVADGYDPDRFGSTAPVSRQAMAAFLRRLLGPAEPTPCTGPVAADVGVDHRFCADIAWLVGAGIATGYDDGTFRPTAPVSRQAMAAFLQRAVVGAEPPACASRPFPDVDASNRFCGHVTWLAAAGVTGGYPDGTYRPTAPVSRQAMARFLRLVDGLG